MVLPKLVKKPSYHTNCTSYGIFFDIENTTFLKGQSAYDGLKATINFINHTYGHVVGQDTQPCKIWVAINDKASANVHIKKLNQCGAKVIRVIKDKGPNSDQMLIDMMRDFAVHHSDTEKSIIFLITGDEDFLEPVVEIRKEAEFKIVLLYGPNTSESLKREFEPHDRHSFKQILEDYGSDFRKEENFRECILIFEKALKTAIFRMDEESCLETLETLETLWAEYGNYGNYGNYGMTSKFVMDWFTNLDLVGTGVIAMVGTGVIAMVGAGVWPRSRKDPLKTLVGVDWFTNLDLVGTGVFRKDPLKTLMAEMDVWWPGFRKDPLKTVIPVRIEFKKEFRKYKEDPLKTVMAEFRKEFRKYEEDPLKIVIPVRIEFEKEFRKYEEDPLKTVIAVRAEFIKFKENSREARLIAAKVMKIMIDNMSKMD